MKYRAITGENFYLTELKNACRFLLRYPESQNIKQLFREQDILDSSSESNFNKKFQTINKRIKAFTPELMKLFIETDIMSAKFINLYSILWNEKLIAEFMDEVIKEKYYLFDYEIKENEFHKFMQYKREQSDIIANWSEAGRKKMIDKLKNFLLEAGYLEKENTFCFRIIKPVIDPSVIAILKSSKNSQFLKIMLY